MCIFGYLRYSLALCVCSFSILGCYPSVPVSWRIAIVRNRGQAELVHLSWGPGKFRPVIKSKSLLHTIDRAIDVWVTSDERVYATWEVRGPRRLGTHYVRVYRRDGTLIGEYQGDGEDRYVSAPVIVEGSEAVCFVTGSGKLVVGRLDGGSDRYAFKPLPGSLPISVVPMEPSFVKTYEIDKARVVFDWNDGRQRDVFEVRLDDGTHRTLGHGKLFGVLAGKPVVIDWDQWRIIVHGEKPRQIGNVRFGGMKSPHRIARLSPCGRFYMYDAGQFAGFRLRVAERRRFGPECVLNELGYVTSLGSWWGDLQEVETSKPPEVTAKRSPQSQGANTTTTGPRPAS